MPDKQEQIRTYSTGEVAEACGVSVRTVQYYDEKGLLPPTGISDGGRRVYIEADVAKLRKILLLKSLGLQLSAIRGVLGSEVSAQVLSDILAEQNRKLEAEIAQKQHALETINRIAQELEEKGNLPAESIAGMEDVMENEKMQEQQLKDTYRTLMAISVPLACVEIAALAHWVSKKDWKPFALVELVNIPLGAALVNYYRERVAYLCPHCREVFKPNLREWFFAQHTPTTRKLKCTKCNTTDWCTEVSAGRLPQDDAQPITSAAPEAVPAT